jgi:apolipoprotein N-acyltransferase
LNYFLAVFSAALLILAFPKWNIAWLAPVALAPLLVAAVRETRPFRRFLVGWVAGIAYWWGVCYWIHDVLEFHGGVHSAVAWALFALFCLAKAIHLGVFAWLSAPLMRLSWAVIAIPALWVAIEITHGYLGFAWLTLGNAGVEMAVPMRLVPYTGVYGISFVFMTAATALALAALSRPRIQLLWVAILPGIIALPSLPEAQRGTSSAILMQPDISETEQWTPETLDKAKDQMLGTSLRAALQWPDADLLVWPEIPGPFYYYDDPAFREDVTNLARIARMHFLLGTVAYTREGDPLNSALLLNPSGDPVARYDKIKLVPFGEFVPPPFDRIISSISSEAGDFRPGNRIVVAPVGERRIATFICYESVFPHLVRQFPREGAEVLFNISNDGWFGETAARDQHLHIVRMRAAENRRWILRSTNDGITASIDAAGRLFQVPPQYVQTVSRAQFNYIQGTTFYTRRGDWFALLCALIAGGGFFFSRRVPAAAQTMHEGEGESVQPEVGTPAGGSGDRNDVSRDE